MELRFRITGMTCAACSARVEKVTSQITGIKKADVNLLAGTMTVDATDMSVSEEIIRAVQKAGYGAYVTGEEKQATAMIPGDGTREMKKRILISGAFLTVLMYFTMGHMLGLPVPTWYHGPENAAVSALLQLFLTLPVVFLNRVYYSRGLKALWNRAANMDSLIAVGSGAALVYSIVALFRIVYALGNGDMDTVKRYSENLYFESAAMILTLITLGKFLETRAKGKTGDAIRQLMDLSPKMATIRISGQEQLVPVEQVKVGDIVIVRSGGSIPVDGTVIAGRASVDQSAITGESIPVEKVESDGVIAATMNTEGYLEIRADRVGDDTTLSQVIRLVEQAGGSKAPIARLADKIAGIFVPVVMTISLVAFIVWMLVDQSLEFSLSIAICVLVISCPCALGLATPVAIMVGTGRAAKMGVLFKNAESLENLHHIDTVVLDKTGTLTAGKPAVTDIIPGSLDPDALLYLAASLEAQSEHPFAKAIVEYYGNGPYMAAVDFETLPGRGVCAIINKKKYYGGNMRLMNALGIQVPEYPELVDAGKTPLYFADEDKAYLGAIVAADVLKSDSADAVQQMKKLGLDVVMLTGDNRRTAEAIGRAAGIEHIVSDVLPADKASVIETLRSEGRNVLMIGDGINDAPALVTADVGMAIGAGTDIAMESANIVLMHNSLVGACQAYELSKATMKNVRQNLFWAFFYNSLGIPVAAGALYPSLGILLSPMIGAAAMSFSSVFVVSNALRLRFFKSKSKLSVKEEKSEVISKEEKRMQNVIKVEGMMCMHCKARVESVCKEVAGVSDAIVDLEKKEVTVIGDASVETLKKAITDAGYEVVS